MHRSCHPRDPAIPGPRTIRRSERAGPRVQFATRSVSRIAKCDTPDRCACGPPRSLARADGASLGNQSRHDGQGQIRVLCEPSAFPGKAEKRSAGPEASLVRRACPAPLGSTPRPRDSGGHGRAVRLWGRRVERDSLPKKAPLTPLGRLRGRFVRSRENRSNRDAARRHPTKLLTKPRSAPCGSSCFPVRT